MRGATTTLQNNANNNKNTQNTAPIHTSFGECMRDIHEYWKQLNLQVEGMDKDIKLLQNMYNKYNQYNTFLHCGEYLNEFKKHIKQKILNIEEDAWKVRRIHFENNQN